MTSTRSGSADNNGSNTRFPSLDSNVVTTERRLRVLSLLCENVLWKKRIAEEFGTTPQTVGRDVDALREDGLLDPTFLAPEDHVRHHLIGFETTDAGEAVLEDYLVCEHCGEVVDAQQDCVHDYVPVQEANQGIRGGGQ